LLLLAAAAEGVDYIAAAFPLAERSYRRGEAATAAGSRLPRADILSIERYIPNAECT
tara:strand:+ start:317 stop:487 length:171 start_codon:yes stop_codon:yes gene_type:complete